MQSPPIISVLMPAYNAEKHLHAAITSVLTQSYSNFEFLILDDGSTDKTCEIVESFNDPRIKLIKNTKNQGLTATLNAGLELVKGSFIARMDADDICMPLRFEKQLEFLKKNPEISAVGSWVKTIGTQAGQLWAYRTDPQQLQCELLFDAPLAHPTVMLRQETMQKNNLHYQVKYTGAEDYGLWLDICQKSQIANIPLVLLHYRVHTQQTGETQFHARKEAAAKIRSQILLALIPNASADELSLHHRISTLSFKKSRDFVNLSEAWLCKIESANMTNPCYNPKALAKMLSHQWWQICSRHTCLGIWLLKKFRSSRLSRQYQLKPIEFLKLIIKCLIRKS